MLSKNQPNVRCVALKHQHSVDFQLGSWWVDQHDCLRQLQHAEARQAAGMGGRGSLDVDPSAAQQQLAAGQQHAKQQQAATAAVLAQPSLQPFLQQDFNAAEFTSHVLAASRTSAQAQAEQLKQGVRQLEQALSTHVISNHHELLQHARRLADTEHSLQDVVLSVSSLQASVKRIRADMEGPYGQVRRKHLPIVGPSASARWHIPHDV